MKITIQRCFKKPGLIDRAKNYFLELNDKGLYIIATGNATLMPRTKNMLQEAIANAAVDHFKNKFEVDIVANEKRILNGELDAMANEKMCYFLEKNQVEVFKVAKDSADAIKVSIKGGKAKLDLLVEMDYWIELNEIAGYLEKK